MLLNKRNSIYQKRLPLSSNVEYGLMVLLVYGCGSSGQSFKDTYRVGFSSDYKAPIPTYENPDTKDQNFKINEPSYVTPYWVEALLMENGQHTVGTILSTNNRTILFSFPNERPSYIPVTILGWAPANDDMQIASKQILNYLEQVLNVKFEETNDVYGPNIISISQSIQSVTGGFSYFPNSNYEIGSDVFMSKTFSNPHFFSSGLTNYDYEILIHEMGHALGLKHPFEGHESNVTVLTETEDHTANTAMSYDDYSFSFDGTFRALDWMALAKLYGVNPLYASGNDTYNFSQEGGIFIIDGAGIDTIDCKSSGSDVYIDLRSGMQSYHGTKSTLITSANQLTISHGSEIENVETGFGNDVVIGNDLENIIKTNDGNDTIFAGNGPDIVVPGFGNDIIDLSEDTASEDTVIFEFPSIGTNTNLLYGFKQGTDGDVIKFENLGISDLKLLPLVEASNVPTGYIDNCLVRVFGEALTSEDNFKEYFTKEGLLQNLKLSEMETALLILSDSQDTGETQNLYTVQKQAEYIEITLFGRFLGNYLDIDNWAVDNFIV